MALPNNRLRFPSELVTLALLAYALPVMAADPDAEPLAAYRGAPPMVTLSADEQRQIAEGDPVFKTFVHQVDVRALAAFQVDAPTRVVWSVITDFEKYPMWVEGVEATRVYRREGDRVHVRFEVDHWFVGRYIYHIEHTLASAENAWTTWRLDRNQASDFDDTVGFWRVSALNEAKSLVTYSATLRLSTWVPKFIERRLVRGTLEHATQWVANRSEIRFREEPRRQPNSHGLQRRRAAASTRRSEGVVRAGGG